MKTKTNPRLMLGCSPRATIAILQNSKAYAAMNGRSLVVPDDTKRILTNSIAHRLQLKAEAELEATTGQIVIEGFCKVVLSFILCVVYFSKIPFPSQILQ